MNSYGMWRLAWILVSLQKALTIAIRQDKLADSDSTELRFAFPIPHDYYDDYSSPKDGGVRALDTGSHVDIVEVRRTHEIPTVVPRGQWTADDDYDPPLHRNQRTRRMKTNHKRKTQRSNTNRKMARNLFRSKTATKKSMFSPFDTLRAASFLSDIVRFRKNFMDEFWKIMKTVESVLPRSANTRSLGEHPMMPDKKNEALVSMLRLFHTTPTPILRSFDPVTEISGTENHNSNADPQISRRNFNGNSKPINASRQTRDDESSIMSNKVNNFSKSNSFAPNSGSNNFKLSTINNNTFSENYTAISDRSTIDAKDSSETIDFRRNMNITGVIVHSPDENRNVSNRVLNDFSTTVNDSSTVSKTLSPQSSKSIEGKHEKDRYSLQSSALEIAAFNDSIIVPKTFSSQSTKPIEQRDVNDRDTLQPRAMEFVDSVTKERESKKLNKGTLNLMIPDKKYDNNFTVQSKEIEIADNASKEIYTKIQDSVSILSRELPFSRSTRNITDVSQQVEHSVQNTETYTTDMALDPSSLPNNMNVRSSIIDRPINRFPYMIKENDTFLGDQNPSDIKEHLNNCPVCEIPPNPCQPCSTP